MALDPYKVARNYLDSDAAHDMFIDYALESSARASGPSSVETSALGLLGAQAIRWFQGIRLRNMLIDNPNLLGLDYDVSERSPQDLAKAVIEQFDTRDVEYYRNP